MGNCDGDCSCSKRQKVQERDKKLEQVDGDDVWLADGDEQHFTPVGVDKDEVFGDVADTPESVNTLALRRAHAKQGFIEGLAQAKLKATQNGFDDGYKNGSNLGLKVGEIISALKCLSGSSNEDVKTKAASYLETLKKELYISNVLQRKYFDEDINLTGHKHQLIDKWESIVADLLSN